MSKFFLSVCVAISLFSLVACKDNKKNTSAAPLTLVMAESNPEDSMSAWVDKAFIEKVAELSNGSIIITLHAAGILGDNTSVMKVMSQPNSGIHIARISPAALVSYDCTKHKLLDIPFTFVNRKHFWNFAFSDTAKTILKEPYEKKIGVMGLFFAEEGFRHFFSTRKLKSVSDFKGEKIRCAGASTLADIARSLHGEPISVSFSDLYSALQTGTVDIAEQPIANYLSNHFNKVAPYMILDGHQLGLTETVITAEVWDSLSPEQQQILIEAGKYAGEYCHKISEETENKSRITLKSEGAVFTEVTDISEWQNACAEIITNASKAYPDLYAEITSLAK